MVKVRRMLTEILLEVTNEEIEDIAREVIKKEKQRALKGIFMFDKQSRLPNIKCEKSAYIVRKMHLDLFLSDYWHSRYYSYIFHHLMLPTPN